MSNKFHTAPFHGETEARQGEASPSAMLFGSNQVVFCINTVLFQNCGLLLDVPSDLTSTSLMKLRRECPNQTVISFATWIEIATNVLGLRGSVAHHIFDVVYALSSNSIVLPTPPAGSTSSIPTKSMAEYRHEANRALLKKMGGVVDEARWPNVAECRQVSLPALVIFLLAQMLLEHPPRAPPADIDPGHVMSSVRQHLHEYIMAVAVTRPGRLTVSDAQELRILLREFVNGVEQPFGTSIGFLWPRSEKTIDITILSQFIRPKIVMPSDLTSDTRLPPFSNNVSVKGLQNTIFIPSYPVVTCSNEKLSVSSSYTIEKCSQTSFYVTADLPHTRLSQLVNCTVALGPVGGILYIERCENCNITALCAAVVVSRCKNTKIFVCTNTPPVLCLSEKNETLENVRFAPYNSHYSTLEEHLASTGINPHLSLWNIGVPSRHILPPEEFTPLCFPIAPHASAVVTTRTNPCPLPPQYADALERRVQRFQETSRQLQSAYQRLEAEGRKELADDLRGKVHTLFVEWLRRIGQERVLVGLLRKSASGQS
ncbi:putative Tubulin binding cofactor C [Trypanosoma vivax]|uniref:Putative tubulin binding cofactor c n=1 Tax=Trypanosoma vivax (strain Y486) TaxID=1055687 RepID=G0UAD0_TRYVY|nr:putative tubulin binding cofactor c [Trypanosoma vivax]KAH8617929.1 putative Tubulin binding cofactor C [Trypanosoma vivax]CCC52763.1 putative tubulin binding cofactor c [Trypanosoma vivax Y486]